MIQIAGIGGDKREFYRPVRLELRSTPWAKSFCPLPLLYPSASDFQFRYAPVTFGSGRSKRTGLILFFKNLHKTFGK